MRKWSVTLRLESHGHRIPKAVQRWVLETFARRGGENVAGFYRDFGDKGIAFLGINSPRFFNTYGWLPKVMPYSDPYQSIPAGETSWFIEFLKREGFIEDREQQIST